MLKRIACYSFANALCKRSVTGHAFQQFDLMFVGSGGSSPQRYRGLPSSMLMLGGENWIFDVGEGTMRQLSHKYGQSSMTTTKVFITHMHMDHIMGLASLIASSTLRPNNNSAPVDVYGPVGLHRFLCEIMQSTETSQHFNVHVHELAYTYEDEMRLWNTTSPANKPPLITTTTAYKVPNSLWKHRKYEKDGVVGGADQWTDAQRKFQQGIKRSLVYSKPLSGNSNNTRDAQFWSLVDSPRVLLRVCSRGCLWLCLCFVSNRLL